MSEKASKGLVLVVDDEDTIRLTLRDYLKKKGYEVLVASDGVGALKQMLDNEVDLILTDYRVDFLGGDYWVKFLKRYCQDKRIIIMSGFLRPDFYIPFEVIYKPFDYAEMEAIVERTLAKPANSGEGS